MRVLHLTTEFPPVIYGGLGTAVGGLARASASAGIGLGVLLFGATEPGPIYGGGRAFGAGWNTRNTEIAAVPFQDLLAIEAAARRLRPDILHLHSFWLWPYARLLRERLKTPLVYTVHSLDRAEYEIGYGPPECLTQWDQQRSTICGADRIIALTDDERVLIERYCEGVGDRVRVVGNGIDDAPARDPGRRSGAGPVVLFGGRFVERKGLWDLLAAIPIVHDEAPEVRFVLADGHRHCSAAEVAGWLLTPRLRAAGDRIRFTGWLTAEQMAREYDDADILVVPSWYEPFGLVVLEGMLHGLAVVASAVGGPASILEHGNTGYLVPPRDPEALAAAVLHLARNADERMRIAAAAGRVVRDRWLWPRVMDRVVDVYAELLGQVRGAGGGVEETRSEPGIRQAGAATLGIGPEAQGIGSAR